MKTTKIRLMALIAALSLMAAAMVGCGDDKGSSSESKAEATVATEAPTEAATEAPVEEDADEVDDISEEGLDLADTIWYIEDVSYTFYDNGTMSASDGSESVSGTYTWDGVSGIATIGEDSAELALVDGTLYLEGEDGEAYALSLSDAVGDPGDEDLWEMDDDEEDMDEGGEIPADSDLIYYSWLYSPYIYEFYTDGTVEVYDEETDELLDEAEFSWDEESFTGAIYDEDGEIIYSLYEEDGYLVFDEGEDGESFYLEAVE